MASEDEGCFNCCCGCVFLLLVAWIAFVLTWIALKS